MTKKYVIFGCFYVCIMCMPLWLTAQNKNLVPNPGFESLHINQPCEYIQSQAEFSTYCKDWVMPTEGTSDIYSTLTSQNCSLHPMSTSPSASGHQQPRNGNGMAGVITYADWFDYHEYLMVELTNTLQIGQEYTFSMYVSRADYCWIATDKLGVEFRTNYINQTGYSYIDAVPEIIEPTIITDSAGWQKVEGTFVADSAYNYLVIGTFVPYTSISTMSIPQIGGGAFGYDYLAYYFVDDVSLTPLCDPIVKITPESTDSVCIGDTLELNAEILEDNAEDYSIYWNSGEEAANIFVDSAGTYIVKIEDTSGTCIAYDTVFVPFKECTLEDLLVLDDDIPNIITPNNDGLNDYFVSSMFLDRKWDLYIYNRWGKSVISLPKYANDWDGTGLPEGMYFYILKNNTLRVDPIKGWVRIVR